MSNILDYLDWRGDLTLDRDPFNEVDNLILAELSYVDLAGIVPLPGSGTSVPLHQAAEAFFSRYPKGKRIDLGVVLSKDLPDLVKKLALCPRFRDARLSDYIDLVDPAEGEQFSALTIETGDGQLYCAY